MIAPPTKSEIASQDPDSPDTPANNLAEVRGGVARGNNDPRGAKSHVHTRRKLLCDEGFADRDCYVGEQSCE